MQDPSTLLAARELNAQPDETILDLCAAPGGKTTFIAQLTENRAHLQAHDADPARGKLIRENCERLGVTCVRPIASPTDAGPYDRILVDAPCSNTGVLRRRVDLRWRMQAAELERLRALQLKLLTNMAGQLKPGGTLVYSTCSLEPEENSGVVMAFLASQPDYRLEAQRQLTPMTDRVDGAYVARLRRAAD